MFGCKRLVSNYRLSNLSPGRWSRSSNFRLWLWFQLQASKVLTLVPAPTSKSFGSGSKMIFSIENWKPLYYLYNSLPHKLGLWNRNPDFRLRLWLYYLKVFGSGSGLNHPKLPGLRLQIWSCFSQITYKQQVLILRLKRKIPNKPRCLQPYITNYRVSKLSPSTNNQYYSA